MANAARTIFRWYAYEPARYQGTPVSVNFTPSLYGPTTDEKGF